ncbi:integrase catalytic domain-containing protein, partial [Leptospira sp. SA-E8]|uniref:integrase catalytic domain-containing protein n=1 Tax=Leptospira sp. SA-E8 TaxID=3422259 RepID=UPI003EB88B34
STSAIVNWYRDFEISGCNAASMVTGNLHKQRRREISTKVEEAMEWALKNFYLNRGRLSLTYTHERLRSKLKEMEDNGEIGSQETKVSLATLQRRKEELDPYTVNAKRYGIPYANQKFRYTIQGTDVPRAMARLEVDHTKLNWVVVCDRTGLPLGRPTLTVVVCSYSGYIVGLYLSFNNAGLTSVVNVLKNSIRPKGDLSEAAGTKNPWISWGVGDTYLLDNGMEFHSKNFQSIAWEIGCDIEYCRVRFPWMKPHVERFMLELDYLTLTSGRIFKPDPNILSIDPKKDAITTLDKLCKGLILFVVDQHAFTPNRRTLECPYDRYAESVERTPP